MKPPPSLATEVQAALCAALGRPVRLTAATPVGGGCISETARLEFAGAAPAFLKWASGTSHSALLAAEAFSLQRLRTTATVRVPAVLAAGEGWLLLEWLEPGRISAAGWSQFGRQLAALHRTPADGYGWAQDNFIGSLPQANGWREDWTSFWRERRLEPQIALARDDGWLRRAHLRMLSGLTHQLDEALRPAGEDGPSLLHGDLWSGNAHGLADGTAAAIDPSSYFGHREVDLAMAELFGGFDARFFAAYAEAWPLRPGYAELRRPIYQLYYLLVHVNLFGGSYMEGVRRTAAAALSELSG